MHLLLCSEENESNLALPPFCKKKVSGILIFNLTWHILLLLYNLQDCAQFQESISFLPMLFCKHSTGLLELLFVHAVGSQQSHSKLQMIWHFQNKT